MHRSTGPLLVLIALLAGVCLWVLWPNDPERYLPGIIPWPKGTGVHLRIGETTYDRDNMRLGLDLQGGLSITMQADLSQVPSEDRRDAMNALIQTLDRRVNAFGVSEATIQQLGDDRVMVQLPGLRDVEEAKRLIGQTAKLEFKEISAATTNSPTPEYIDTGLTGADLRRASVGFEPTTNQPVVNFQFKDEAAVKFGELTTRLAGQSPQGRIAIFLDDQVVTAPVVRSPILGGSGIIEGGFTRESAQTLAVQLNSGALPVPVQPIREQTVDATLGADSIARSILAGEIGLGAVMLFMVLYYRVPGVLASLALVIYTLIVLAIFKLIPVTLTLAGIAGFILSIGMAVDANILIFERTREELRAGRSVGAAIEAGFERAWTSIRDSNISTIITCVILYYFADQLGISIVKGFALTLGIGVVVSMFTAITVTRTFIWATQSAVFQRGAADEARPRAMRLFGVTT
ncbi:MAG TPA: protein translocase subunit SecD [Dehalococcoidia bacterium]|nr:protein translocase subunit SecD [Dehalococcoidia bacterium]